MSSALTESGPSNLRRRLDQSATARRRASVIRKRATSMEATSDRPARASRKKNPRAAVTANDARRASGHPRNHRSATIAAMPALPKMDSQRAAA